MKKYRIAGLILTFCMAAQLLSGCTIAGKEIRFEADDLSDRSTVIKINKEKCDISIAKLYLCNYRSLYGSEYGLKLWESDDGDLLSYAKDVTIQELSYIICMDLLAAEQEMSLDDEEKELCDAAASEYYDSLTDEEISFMGISEWTLKGAYEDYALAEKLYNKLTEGTDEEVSDDEARVVHVQQIIVKDEDTADEIEKKLEAGSDFEAVAAAYGKTDDLDQMIARDEYPQEVENIVFNLDDDEVSERIDTDDGYYFVKCINRFEEELTEQNKVIIRERRQKEQFEASYEQFVDEATFQINKSLWEEVNFDGTKDITTSSFFTVYDNYFSQNNDEEATEE
jgi:foldase protein PrsA